MKTVWLLPMNKQPVLCNSVTACLACLFLWLLVTLLPITRPSATSVMKWARFAAWQSTRARHPSRPSLSSTLMLLETPTKTLESLTAIFALLLLKQSLSFQCTETVLFARASTSIWVKKDLNVTRLLLFLASITARLLSPSLNSTKLPTMKTLLSAKKI